MREIYLFPYPSKGIEGLFFIFGQEPKDHTKLPRDNSVRRAMLSILDKGKRLRMGGMLFLAEDIDKFGAKHYKNNFKIPEELIVK